jgi:addiction module RelE/StbE family toxin
MKIQYNIIYLPIAQKDLLDIFDYICEDDPAAASDFIGKLDKAISKLGSFPLSGVIPKDERLRLLGYRMLVFQNYLVFYVVKEKSVEIRRILHGCRRYSFLL